MLANGHFTVLVKFTNIFTEECLVNIVTEECFSASLGTGNLWLLLYEWNNVAIQEAWQHDA
jgi:hypothetical protein